MISDWLISSLLMFQVLTYTTANMNTLTVKTRAFRDAMFNSTLPWQMIDSAAGRVSVIRCVIYIYFIDY